VTSNVEVLVGPPGTGKTTTLLHRLQAELERTPSDKIAFTSFTRAAREEVISRVGARFSLGPDDFPWLRTVHGTAYRLLGEPGRVLDGYHWKEFASAYGYNLTPLGRFSIEEGARATPRQTQDDVLRATYEWGRNRGLDIEHTLSRAPARVNSDSLRRFVQRYGDFKRDKKLMDFNDLIERALERGEMPPVDVAFVDEAQDLSPLQIRAVQTWFARCRVVHIAGDDDQAIYGFQGADPGWLLQLAQRYPAQVLMQSHRVPAKVHELAQRIIRRNTRRIQKVYNPRAVEGSVDWRPFDAAVQEIDGSVETLVLVRNRCFLKNVEDDLLSRGVLYLAEGGGAMNPLDPQIFGAARAAQAVAAGAGVNADDLRSMLALVPSNGFGLLPRGMKTAAEKLKGSIAPDVVAKMLRGGTLLSVAAAEGPLAVLKKLEPAARRYLERVQKRHGSFVSPKVHLTTIHGAKGREADLVVVIPDMTKATYRESLDQRHGGDAAEHRVAYVAATRAKERLVIASPRTQLSYVFPRVSHVTNTSSQPLAA
jgi:DNA helicase II / ATP-dependent DNA helicase PcrA